MASINQQVRTGNIVKVMFDGKEIGLVQSVSMQDDYGPEPASGIGDIHVQEYAPTMARHTLQVSVMVLRRQTMLSLGISLENGDDALRGIVFDIVSFDKDDGTILRAYRGCSYASGGLEVSKHAIVMQSGTFNALDVTGNV